MVLLAALILSIAIALARGGRFGRFGDISFRYGWLAILAFGLQALIIYFPLPSSQGFWAPRTVLLMGSYGLLIAVVVINRRLPGLPIIGLGLALNLAVMVANGGFMPVAPEALRRAGLSGLALSSDSGARLKATKDILLGREATSLWILSDVLAVPPPLGTVFSPGDVLLAVGAFILFQQIMVASTPASELAGERC